MSFHPRRYIPEYKPPGVDSSRARAQATLFLVSARTLANVTAEGLARQWRLKPATAALMLEKEKQRREQWTT